MRDQKGGEHGEQVGEEERGIYSKPGKGNRGEEKGREGV